MSTRIIKEGKPSRRTKKGNDAPVRESTIDDIKNRNPDSTRVEAGSPPPVKKTRVVKQSLKAEDEKPKLRVVPPEEERPNRKKEAAPKVDPESIKRNVESRKAKENSSKEQERAVGEAFKMIMEYLEAEYGGKLSDAFWVRLRDECVSRVGAPSLAHVKADPMSDDDKKDFLKEHVPWLKYHGKTVQHVLKKDPGHLKKLATTPTRFQKDLSRLLARKEYKNLK